MVLVLLHDAEDAGWRLASLRPARHRRAQDPAVGVVDGHLLALDRYDRHDRLARGARSRPLGGMLGTGLAGRGVGGRSRSQRRQGGRGRERHNRRRCPSPDYLGGLGPRASTCHAMSGVREDPVETNTENGWMVPVIRPVVNRHFHVIRLTSCGLFVRCMSLVLAHRVIARRRSNSVAFGAKRTFSVPRLQYLIYEYAAGSPPRRCRHP